MQDNDSLPLPGEETGVISADAGQNSETTADAAAHRMSWDEIMADPEYRAHYDAQVKSIVQRRLRGRQNAEDDLTRLRPVLDAITERFGSTEQSDLTELAESVRTGATRSEREQRQNAARQRLASLHAESERLKASFPDFDLAKAMEDRRFVLLTAPDTGLSAEDAYFALHRQEIGRDITRKSMEAASRAVRAGSLRPIENAASQSASRMDADPRSLTREQREALRKRIHDAATLGRKVYPE